MTKNCGNCKFWVKKGKQCTSEHCVRENLNEVSGMGEMMTDIMMGDGVNTFGTPADYHCMYYEEKGK